MKVPRESLEAEVEVITRHLANPQLTPSTIDGLVRARTAVLKQLNEMERSARPKEPARAPKEEDSPAPRPARRTLRAFAEPELDLDASADTPDTRPQRVRQRPSTRRGI